MARARHWGEVSPRLDLAATEPLRWIAPVMMAMLSSKDVLPPPCGPTSAIARGVAFIRVECSFGFFGEFSGGCFWDMCASAFKDQWLYQWLGGPRPRTGMRPSRCKMLAPLQGQCKAPQTTCHKI